MLSNFPKSQFRAFLDISEELTETGSKWYGTHKASEVQFKEKCQRFLLSKTNTDKHLRLRGKDCMK